MGSEGLSNASGGKAECSAFHTEPGTVGRRRVCQDVPLSSGFKAGQAFGLLAVRRNRWKGANAGRSHHSWKMMVVLRAPAVKKNPPPSYGSVLRYLDIACHLAAIVSLADEEASRRPGSSLPDDNLCFKTESAGRHQIRNRNAIDRQG